MTYGITAEETSGDEFIDIVEEKKEPEPLVFLLYGEINDESVGEVSGDLINAQYLPDDQRPPKCKMLINSQGGDLHTAFAFIEIMNASRIPIETIALGQCVSAGLFIFMAGTPGMRIITPTCSVMSHTYSMEIGGNHWDLKEIQKELANMQERILDHYMRCTGLTKQFIMKNLIGKADVWMKPEMVLKYNLADRIDRIDFEWNNKPV